MITHYAIAAAIGAQLRDQIATSVAASRRSARRGWQRPLNHRHRPFGRRRSGLGQPHAATV
jgi:hypothetical protein